MNHLDNASLVILLEGVSYCHKNLQDNKENCAFVVHSVLCGKVRLVDNGRVPCMLVQEETTLDEVVLGIFELGIF